jgi:hypothetical protein
MFWPSGACVASASITTSSSTITSTACPIAARAEVESRLTARTVEIFLKGERIAQPPDPGSAAPTRPHRHGSGFRRARSRHRGRPARMGDFVGIRKEPLKLQIGCRAPRPTQLTTCIAATTAEPSCIDMLRERFASGIAEKPIKYKLPF